MSNMKVTDFNGCWCEATEENCNKLIEMGFTDKYNDRGNKHGLKHKALLLSGDMSFVFSVCDEGYINKYMKQIHLVNGEWEYIEPKDETEILKIHKEIIKDADDFSGANGLSEEDKRKLNNFLEEEENRIREREREFVENILACEKDYIEIDGLKFHKHKEYDIEFVSVSTEREILGYIIHDDGDKIANIWDGKTGKGMYQETYKVDLIPIKPKWYEDESNFPCACMVSNAINGHIVIFYECKFGDTFITRDKRHYETSNWKIRPATEEEVQSLLVKE